MIEDKITIADYAKIKGISKQAVYQKLNKSLKEFLILEQGKKYISINALTANELKKLEQVEQVELNNIKQENSTPKKEDKTDSAEVVFLRQQIEEKDRQIEMLMEQAKSLSEQNLRLSELLKNDQFLLATEQANRNTNFVEENTETKQNKKGGFFSLFRKKS